MLGPGSSMAGNPLTHLLVSRTACCDVGNPTRQHLRHLNSESTFSAAGSTCHKDETTRLVECGEGR